MVPVILGLLLTGSVLVLASFIFGSSFSSKSDKRIMTEEEIERLVERRFHEVKYKLDDEAEKSADQIKDQTERELEKLSNEKIMAVNEYSDQVMDQINKNHNEVMFLYSMLSDKQKELDYAVERLNRFKQQAQDEERLADHRKQQAQGEEYPADDGRRGASATEKIQAGRRTVQPQEMPKTHNTQADHMKAAEQDDANQSQKYNNRDEIMNLYAQGMSSLEIAQKLHLGIGEVRLVLELQKGR